jgi:outer membrane protein OmpA-like peptidoglycan-associated protein
MIRTMVRPALNAIFAALAAAMAISVCGDIAIAGEQLTDSQILQALTAKRRALPMAPADESRAREQERIIQNAMQKTGRGLGRLERDELMAVAQERAKIDLEVNFDYDSAAITPQGIQSLVPLGSALSNNSLSGFVFMIAGHTDGKGSAPYNLGLSERRAQAVKQFLMDRFKRPEDSMISVGYGMEQLKNKSQPFAAENRRVQVVNIAMKPAAAER